jgi:long-chain acyl-CoA synthetase
MKKYENVVEMFEDSCFKYGEREIYGTKNSSGTYEWITYKEIGAEVNDLRAGLKLLGMERGDSVGIISKNCVEWATSCYASTGLSGIHVPMYESQKIDDWEYIIHDANVKFLLVANNEILMKILEHIEKFPQLNKLICLEELSDYSKIFRPGKSKKSAQELIISYRELLKLGQKTPCAPIYPKRDDILTIIYTSGTTGLPKGVELTHKNIFSNLYIIPSLITVTPSDRLLSFLPWAHIFGNVGEVHYLISVGASAGFAESVNTILQNLSEVRPTVLFAVPRIFGKIYDGVQNKIAKSPAPVRYLFKLALDLSAKNKAHQDLSFAEKKIFMALDTLLLGSIRKKFGGRLRFAVSGASALSKEIAEFLYLLGIMVYEAYGLTETSPLVSGNSFKEFRFGTVGKVYSSPFAKIEVKIMREGVHVDNLEIDEGEIVVFGDNVMKGYHNLPKETSEVIDANGGFHTGDLGRFDKDGFLKVTGRIKEQYKMENGKYVVPSPVEEVIKLSRFINQALIYGENRPYNIALLGVDKMAMVAKAKELNWQINVGDKDFFHSEEVRNLIQEELKGLKSKLRSYEMPKKFFIVDEEWTSENGFLTPSLKPKRKVIFKNYAKDIEGLY